MAIKKSPAGTCTRPPRWVMYVCIAVILVVVSTLLYQFFVKARPEHFFSGQPTNLKFHLVYVHMEGCTYCEQFSKAGWADFVKQKKDDMRAKGIDVKDYDRADPEWQAMNISVQGFPTVLLVDAATGKEVSRFSGERTAEGLAAWAEAAAAKAP